MKNWFFECTVLCYSEKQRADPALQLLGIGPHISGFGVWKPPKLGSKNAQQKAMEFEKVTKPSSVMVSYI